MLFSPKTYGISIISDEGTLASEVGLTISEFSESKVTIESHSKMSMDQCRSEIGKKNTIVSLSSDSIITIQAENQNTLEAINSFFPGVASDTFFTQRLGDVLALINKDELNSILIQNSEKGLNTSRLILEPIALAALQRTTDEPQVSGIYNDALGQSINQHEMSEESSYLSIDGKNLNTMEYLAFGACLAVEALEVEEAGHPEQLAASSQSMLEERNLKTLLVACVSLLLFISLGNYFYYSHLVSVNNELDQELYSSNASQERLEALKEKVNQFQQLRSGINEVSDNQGAYLLDQLGNSLPKEIAFKKLSLEAPKKIKEGYQIEFSEDVLTLEGKTASTMALNDWIEKLTELNLVEDVKLMNYEDSKEKRGDFTLKLMLVDA